MGGEVFFKRFNAAQRGRFFLGLGGQRSLELLELIGRQLLFQPRGFGFQERADLIFLGFNGRLAFVVGFDLLFAGGRHLGVFGAGEDAFQGVVIGRGNRVVLVVVATGTRDGKPQEPAGEGIDPVGILVELLGVSVVDRPASKEAQGRQPLGALGPLDQVAGDLLDHEPVVRQVAVEAPTTQSR